MNIAESLQILIIISFGKNVLISAYVEIYHLPYIKTYKMYQRQVIDELNAKTLCYER